MREALVCRAGKSQTCLRNCGDGFPFPFDKHRILGFRLKDRIAAKFQDRISPKKDASPAYVLKGLQLPLCWSWLCEIPAAAAATFGIFVCLNASPQFSGMVSPSPTSIGV